MKLLKNVPNALPTGVIGNVVFFGFAKIVRNVLKCRSGLISGEFKDAFVVGTFRIPFEKSASGWLFVVRYLTSAQASVLCFVVFGIPMIVPLTLFDPYRSRWALSTGIGAVAYFSSGCSAAMNATRHSPSICMASFPVSNAFDAENSSPTLACHRFSLSAPYQSIKPFDHLRYFIQPGSFERFDFPLASSHLAPKRWP